MALNAGKIAENPAPPGRFEHPTVGLEGRCSIQLSYGGGACAAYAAGASGVALSSEVIGLTLVSMLMLATADIAALLVLLDVLLADRLGTWGLGHPCDCIGLLQRQTNHC